MTTNPTVPTEEQVEQAEREMEAEYPTIVESSRFYRQALIRVRAKTIQLQSEIERFREAVESAMRIESLWMVNHNCVMKFLRGFSEKQKKVQFNPLDHEQSK